MAKLNKRNVEKATTYKMRELKVSSRGTKFTIKYYPEFEPIKVARVVDEMALALKYNQEYQVDNFNYMAVLHCLLIKNFTDVYDQMEYDKFAKPLDELRQDEIKIMIEQCIELSYGLKNMKVDDTFDDLYTKITSLFSSEDMMFVMDKIQKLSEFAKQYTDVAMEAGKMARDLQQYMENMLQAIELAKQEIEQKEIKKEVEVDHGESI